MADTWTVEDDTSLLLNDGEQSLVSAVFRLRKPKTRRTRNDIARDVKSGGAGSDGGTAPAVTLSAK